MKQYTVRDEKGVMVAAIGEQVLSRMLLNVNGVWRPYKTKQGDDTRCYEVTEDCTFGLGNGDSVFRLYLWKGTIIVED